LNNQWTITSNVSYTYGSADRRSCAWVERNPTGPSSTYCTTCDDGSNLYLEMNDPNSLTDQGLFAYVSHRYLPRPDGGPDSRRRQRRQWDGTVYWGLGDNAGTVRDVVQ